MKQEEIFKTLVEELMKIDTVHHEYMDNNNAYVIDSQKNGNELIIRISIKENKDKKEFEEWLETVDDDLFSEVLDELKETEKLVDIEQLYNSKDYKKAIDKIKSKTKEIAQRKIKELQKLINSQMIN